jgi:hypothetical protein
MGFGKVSLNDRIKDNLEKNIDAIECESGSFEVQWDKSKK